MDIYEKISDRVAELTPQLTAWRRDLHRSAEPAWREIRTCSIIAAHLESLGYDVIAGQPVFDANARMGLPGADILDEAYERAIRQGVDPAWAERFKDGFTGVIGILHCGEGPTVAMRFDIDGLLLQETENENHFPNIHGFRSENEGVMHACGHDAHIVFGLGTARILAEMKENLHGTVKLIFQPAEEGVQGARAIVAKGHLDDVDVLIGSHVTEQDGFGSNVTPGSEGFLATTKMDVVFRGVAAHAGASPQTGSSAILAAATAVLNLHAISRHSAGASRVNVGVIHGGTSRNVVADEVKLQMEVRGETTEINEYVHGRAVQILKSAADMHDCTVEVKTVGASEAFTCDDAVMDRVYETCEKLGLIVSEKRVQWGGGSEDFSLMLNRVQARGGAGTFLRIRADMKAALHHRDFDISEDILPRGVAIFSGMAANLMCDGRL